MKAFLLSMILFAFIPTPCIAFPDAFDCKVLSLNELSHNGSFVTNAKYQTEQIGSTFSVDRKSGEIRGGHFLNNSASESIRVINNDPAIAGFYVISQSHGPGVMISYLFINTYKDENRFSFIYTNSGQYVYTGVCQ